MTNKVLHIGLVGPMPPPNGGMAMQTEQLMRLLTAEGVEVTFVPVNAVYRPAFIEAIPGLRALFRLVPYLLTVWRTAGRVDVIHLMANSGWSWQLFAAPVLWLAALRDTPVIVNYRGGEAGDYFKRSFRWVKPSLDKAAAVVVPSGFLKAIFGKFDQPTRVIPNIIDLNRFRPTENKTTGEQGRHPITHSRASETFRLVITRNLEPIYGIDNAIRALAKVQAADVSVRLLIAGSGPAKDDLVQLAMDLGVAEQIEFVGRLDRDGIVALYGGADAMLNPTHVDNMPNSVLEALACGLPVISTDVGGVPYILTHEKTGLLVPPADPEALASAILRLGDDETLRQRLRDNGLDQVQQYTWERVRDLWLNTYRDVVAASGKIA